MDLSGLSVIGLRTFVIRQTLLNLKTFWFIDPVTDIIGIFFSLFLTSSIVAFGNVSRDTSLIIDHQAKSIDLFPLSVWHFTTTYKKFCFA